MTNNPNDRPEIRIENYAALHAALSAFGSIQQDVLDAVMEEAVDEMRKDASIYPPPPPNSWYERTFTLKRGWTGARIVTRVSAYGREKVASNATSYGPDVQDRVAQAAVHKRTGWVTIQDIVERYQQRVARRLQQAGETVVNEIARRAR